MPKNKSVKLQKVTKILYAETEDMTELSEICKSTGFIRADIWRRYGAFGTIGKTALEIRKAITGAKYYADFPLDGTIRNETTKDIINDIFLYKEAAKVLVRQDIFARAKDDMVSSKELFVALAKEDYLGDPFIHRRMRFHFKHGVSHTDNQFIVRSDRHESEIIDGQLTITIKVAKKYGKSIVLTSNSNGKNVVLDHSNLRIIVRNGQVEIHYASNKPAAKKPCGTKEIGVDKGYTECFADSDGDFHGQGFGKVMTEFSDKTKATYQNKNKLYALEIKHLENGDIEKADKIRKNNLGTKKVKHRKASTHQQLKDLAYKSAHNIVDKAGLVVAEDLTKTFSSNHQWKNYNRKMSAWAKGVLTDALIEVTHHRNAQLIHVNCAYTSQMDSTTGLLQGKRVGDKFYCENGDVLHADTNGALNVLDRLYDEEITRYMPYKKVKSILIERSFGGTDRQGLEFGV